MAVSLLDFLYDTNEVFAEKAYNLVKCWRIGVKSCLSETDLLVYNMYRTFLGTDLTDYNYTYGEITNIINSIVNIFNITNVIIDEGDVINYITNNNINNIVYNTTYVYGAPTYTTTYAGLNEFTVSITHGLNKYNPTIIVTDTSTGSRIRVEVGIVEIDENNIVISFSSTSSGDITIM